MSDPEDLAGGPVAAFWEDLQDDAAATAEEYREEGWEAMELHPGDVTALSGTYGDRVGIDVLIPDNEYEDVAEWFEEGFEVDGYEVYRTTVLGTVFGLVVVRDEGGERAVLYPVFYAANDEEVEKLFERADEEGAIHTYLRRLSGEFVEFRHDDPDLFAPPDDVEDPPEDPDELVEEMDDAGTAGDERTGENEDGEESESA